MVLFQPMVRVITVESYDTYKKRDITVDLFGARWRGFGYQQHAHQTLTNEDQGLENEFTIDQWKQAKLRVKGCKFWQTRCANAKFRQNMLVLDHEGDSWLGDCSGQSKVK